MSDLVELKKLKNLIAVAEAGNISVAAKRLYLSQPSLSIQIKDLEDVMQVPLLVRDHKGVRATPAAEILITGGRELLRMRDEMIGMARALHRVTFVPMRLGFSSFVDHALYEMVCSIHTSLFPSCEIKPKSGDPVDLLLMLERGEIDAALVTLPASGAGLKAYPFTQSRLVRVHEIQRSVSKAKRDNPGRLWLETYDLPRPPTASTSARPFDRDAGRGWHYRRRCKHEQDAARSSMDGRIGNWLCAHPGGFGVAARTCNPARRRCDVDCR
jgi:DNA-binding transcriptional LysR family regulator